MKAGGVLLFAGLGAGALFLLSKDSRASASPDRARALEASLGLPAGSVSPAASGEPSRGEHKDSRGVQWSTVTLPGGANEPVFVVAVFDAGNWVSFFQDRSGARKLFNVAAQGEPEDGVTAEAMRALILKTWGLS